MSIIFLNKVYAEALDVINSDLKTINDGNQLLASLRACDISEIKAHTQAFLKIINSFYKDNYSICLCKTMLDSVTMLNVDEYVHSMLPEVLDESSKMRSNFKACALMDGTVCVWQCDEESKLGFSDLYALEIGKVKGPKEMLETPNWCY